MNEPAVSSAPPKLVSMQTRVRDNVLSEKRTLIIVAGAGVAAHVMDVRQFDVPPLQPPPRGLVEQIGHDRAQADKKAALRLASSWAGLFETLAKRMMWNGVVTGDEKQVVELVMTKLVMVGESKLVLSIRNKQHLCVCRRSHWVRSWKMLSDIMQTAHCKIMVKLQLWHAGKHTAIKGSQSHAIASGRQRKRS